MQRLEVSGAVRPLYGSLGVKGLMSETFWAHKKWKKNINWCFSLLHGYHSNPTTPKLQHTAQHSFSLLHEYHPNPATPNLQHTSNQEHTTNVVIQQNSRKLLMMDILMSETCWEHKKWNKNSKWHQVGLSFPTIVFFSWWLYFYKKICIKSFHIILQNQFFLIDR